MSERERPAIRPTGSDSRTQAAGRQALYLLHNNLGYCLNARGDHRQVPAYPRA